MKRILSLGLLATMLAVPAAIAQTTTPAKPAPVQPAKPTPKEVQPATPAPKAATPTKVEPKSDAKAVQPASASDATGPEHKVLAGLDGEWQWVMKEFGPDGTASDAGTGTATCKMILGGRFLSQELDGRFHGKFFRGAGMMGYNNAEKRFENAWAESSSTGLMYSSGTANSSGKVITLTGDANDPGTGQRIKTKTVLTINSDTTHTEEMYKVVGGKDVKLMEVTYTKGKAPAKDTKPAVEKGK